MKSYTLEEAKTLRTELGPAAVDVSLLSDEVRAGFLAWLSGDGPEIQPETSEAQKSEITHAWLTSIDGIGKKGAEAILEELATRGVTTFAAFAKIEDLTKLPAIGKKNGANLRAALDEVAGPYDPVAERREHLLSTTLARIGDDDIARGIASERIETGVYDTALMDPNLIFKDLVDSAAGYASRMSVTERWKDSPTFRQPILNAVLGRPVDTDTRSAAVDRINTGEYDYEITRENANLCPHCNGLFDRAPIGAYDSGEAWCSVEDGAGEGNCGQTFWLVAKDWGYVTHKTNPKYAQYTITGQGVVDEVVPELAPSASDLIPPETLPDGGEAVLDWPAPAATAEPVELAPALIPIHERIHLALTSCRALAKTKPHSDDWHKARAQGVGSSDAGAILGVSPYAKAHDVWASKLGHEAKQKPWLEDYADFGTWFEPYIREWCEDEHGIEIIDGADLGTLQSVVWPRALANIDGLDITNGVVEEYKTTTEKWTEIPAHYFAQVQHQMLVTGVREVRLRQYVSPMDRKLIPSLRDVMLKLNPFVGDRDLARWLLEHGEVHTWIIERDDRYIERMLEREKSFWAFVEMEVEPVEAEPEGSADLSADPDVYAACMEYARLSERFDQQALAFLKAEGVEPSKRGSVSGSATKVLDAAKKKARTAIEKAVSLLEDAPKRVTIGTHSATLVDRGTHKYWNIYTGEAAGEIPL